jgi:hypothetical protein
MRSALGVMEEEYLGLLDEGARQCATAVVDVTLDTRQCPACMATYAAGPVKCPECGLFIGA